MVKTEKTLQERKADIEELLESIDEKPYSHNMISINLRAIAEKHGRVEANKVIEELGLKDYGYSPVK
jgi:hypothetical protein